MGVFPNKTPLLIRFGYPVTGKVLSTPMPLLYTFYGDDFTGSTDVLEQLASAGVPAVLFLAPPTPAQLAAFPHVQAIGIAGDSRSRTPAWMSSHLPPIWAALQRFRSPITHYKTCSTFDSSPSIGSIGRAIELGLAAFTPRFVPVLVGAPHLRRFVAFGHLFAAGPTGEILRIDRHPMAHHPVTPMRESDLRRHLALQTQLPIGLLDLTEITPEALDRQLAPTYPAPAQRASAPIILFDTVDATTQQAAGELLWREALRQPLFAAGSSGLTSALISAWSTRGLIPPAPPQPTPKPAVPLLVLSGSCSPVTERQIRHALAHGFHGLSIDPARLLSPETAASYAQTLTAAALASLAEGRHTILYTTLGSPEGPAHGDGLGHALGALLRDLLARTAVSRVLLCGGDTSSHAVQQLDLVALTWRANLQPGAPLCRAHTATTTRPLELVLKGGQVGTEDFFNVVRRGGS
jgi:uncharacterized protein YgbK (DUF1537 family)